MPGQNPYSPYLPANNPSIFPESKEEKKKSNLGAILGIGGAGLGLLFGGPAGMKTGMAVGSGVGGLFDNSGSPQSQMSSLQQVAGAMQSGERIRSMLKKIWNTLKSVKCPPTCCRACKLLGSIAQVLCPCGMRHLSFFAVISAFLAGLLVAELAACLVANALEQLATDFSQFIGQP